MPLEATMIIIDNSEYMRNGDYPATRFDAQSDAVNVLFQTKIDSNPENTVGIMTMAGKAPEVLVTHTKEMGHILSGVHSAKGKIGGEIDIPTALAVAQLALKHRENKNLRQRIIVFVASPPDDADNSDEESMVKLAKKLKKNNVAVDIVAFGDGIEEGPSVLKAFVDNINNSDNSHLVSIQPGAHLLSDVLISSPILAGDRSSSIPAEFGGSGAASAPAAGGSGGGGEFEFGVDPSLDPELAMALRMSMQEAQAREAADAAARAPAASASAPAPAASGGDMAEDDDEERALQEALALSTQPTENKEDDEEDDDEDDDDEDADADGDGDIDMEDDDEDGEGDEDDDDIQQAIAMSMQPQNDGKKK